MESPAAIDQYVERLPEAAQQLLAVEYFGNNPIRWGVAALVFVATLVLLRLLRAFLSSRLGRFAERTETEIDDLLCRLLDKTSWLVLIVVAFSMAGRSLDLSAGVEGGLHGLLFIALAVQAGIWANHVLAFVIEKYLAKREEGRALRVAVLSLFGFFGRVAIWSLVLLLALDNFGFDVTALIAGLGVGGIAIGLALQNVLQDVFASLSIVLDKPFVIGDFVVIGDFAGTIERIGIKTTRIRSLSGEQLVFGNGDLLSSRIRNYKQMAERRVVFAFGVVYQTPADQLEAIPGMVAEIVGGLETARHDRAHFHRFGDSSLDFEVVYWVESPDYLVYMDCQQSINLALVRKFEAEGIEFAYPTRTLFIEGGQPAGEAAKPAGDEVSSHASDYGGHPPGGP